MQRDGLELWVTLVEVGGNLDAVQQRSAGPGVVPSASEAVVSAALLPRVRAWNLRAGVLAAPVPHRCWQSSSGCQPRRALWDPFGGGDR